MDDKQNNILFKLYEWMINTTDEGKSTAAKDKDGNYKGIEIFI